MLSVVKGIEPRDQVEGDARSRKWRQPAIATMTFARRLNHVENYPAAGQRGARLQ